ncbi:CDP-diacylglycerol-glycerol-3-phosphate 3-phosphatidyltransferase [Acrasis kona]|uniref:CDP-diacylglycerol--glycerol-3-phosphate 3-phosphatidyltransferase n=1 Tax=Acrasis kona TaxID=1008807 RepID=A0AAW2YV76_9EUKA
MGGAFKKPQPVYNLKGTVPGALHKKLVDIAPSFPVKADSIRFLIEPKDFLEHILEGIKNAKKTIILSTLYLGTGPAEQQIINAITSALEENPELRVTFLFDYLRGTRGGKEKSSLGMVLPLVIKHGDRVDASFYHTPKLKGILKRLLPEAANEVVGVHHMKIYIFDDDLTLTGANLSDWYFVDRQDRYVCIKAEQKLRDYFVNVVKVVNSFSYLLNKNGDLILPGKVGVPDGQIGSSDQYTPYDPVTEDKSFIRYAFDRVLPLMSNNASESSFKDSDTWIYPMIQMGPAHVRHEEYVIDTILSVCRYKLAKIHMSSPYFNITDKLSGKIFNDTSADVHVLTASPSANGFFNAKNYFKHIPFGYNLLELDFYREILRRKQQHRVKVFEYSRRGWTFHSKGMWIKDFNGKTRATVIGSSNFSQRSADRDTEAQILISSNDRDLSQRMERDRRNNFDFAHQVDKYDLESIKRAPKVLVRLFVRRFRNYL